MAIKVTLHELANSGQRQQEIAHAAIRLLEQALNHGSFAGRVRAARFTRWHEDDAGRHSERTVEEVLDIIQTGRELRTGNDYEIDLRVRLERLRRWPRRNRVLGSTDIGGPTIVTAYWFINECIDRADPGELAAHWMHEWLHVAGFFHRGGQHRARRRPVCHRIDRLRCDR